MTPETPQGEFVTFPGSPFELFEPFAPAGDQSAAIAQLAEGINDGKAFQILPLGSVCYSCAKDGADLDCALSKLAA